MSALNLWMGVALRIDSETASGAEDGNGVVGRACAGEESAWRELLELYGRRVFAFVQSRLRRADLAEEVTQSVFATVAVQLQAGRYQEDGRFESWLFRIAANRLRDEIRRERRQASPTDSAQLSEVVSDVDGSESAEPLELELMRCALAELNESDAQVVSLRHHGEMGFREIGDMLGQPVGTVLARHHRALKKLAARIEELRAERAGTDRAEREAL